MQASNQAKKQTNNKKKKKQQSWFCNTKPTHTNTSSLFNLSYTGDSRARIDQLECRDTDCLVKTPLHAHYNHYTPLLRILIHTPQYFHSHTHYHIRIRQCNHTMQFTYCLIRLCSTNCLPLDPFELYQHHCRSNYTPILYKTHI